MNIVLVGSGKWGKNYISTIQSYFPNVNLIVANRDNWKDLIDKKPYGVIIATPPNSHIEIACHALMNDIPVMIEKPLSLSLKEAKVLNVFSAPILVNHIHLFSEGYEKIKRLVDVNDITAIKTCGYGQGLPRQYSSLWDYGPHDLAMILDIIGEMPDKIDVKKLTGDMYALYMEFIVNMDFGLIKTETILGSGANCKTRHIEIHSDGIILSYNDVNKPAHHKPALNTALEVFFKSIDGQLDPRLGLDLSFKILKILEDCDNLLIKKT